jgi:protein O-GlcNAc transferase
VGASEPGRAADVTEWTARSRRAALALSPAEAGATNDLAASALRAGRAAEALVFLDRALAYDPSEARLLANKALALLDLGRATLSTVRRTLPAAPSLVPILVAGSLMAGEEDAIRWAARAVAVSPDPYTLLRLARAATGADLDTLSTRSIRRSLALAPSSSDAWNQLGTTTYSTGKVEQAALLYRRATSPSDHATAYANLALALHDIAELAEAARASRRAISLAPDQAEGHTNRANVLQERCDLRATTEARFRVLAIAPAHRAGLSNLLMTLAYAGDREDARARLASRWWQRFKPLRSTSRRSIRRAKGRRLRVGYVSSFTLASTRLLALAGVMRHDPKMVEVVAYVSRRRGTALPTQLGPAVSDVRDITDMNDEKAAEIVANDGVEVLVDLCGHTPGNRLGIFAHRPAPTQITWVESFFSTGLAEMDWFLTDPLHSPEENRSAFSERLLRMPHIRFCYAAPEKAPDVVEPPSLRGQAVTFGCFNYPAKITDDVVAVWARVLKAVPRSRLRLKWWSFDDAETRERCVNRFARHGVGHDRLEFAGASPHYAMLAEYGEIDIALDPFPFTGGVTTCEALWMGVPVVTLCGTTIIGRQTASILRVIGAGDLIAETTEEYCAKAAALAHRVQALRSLRMTLREQLRRSPLMDADGFARDLEAVYERALAMEQ